MLFDHLTVDSPSGMIKYIRPSETEVVYNTYTRNKSINVSDELNESIKSINVNMTTTSGETDNLFMDTSSNNESIKTRSLYDLLDTYYKIGKISV